MEEVFQIRSCIEMDDIKSTQLMVQWRCYCCH